MGNIFVGSNQVKKIYKGSTLIAEIKESQSKSVTINSNGLTTITPDSGKTLDSVNVTTLVSGNPIVGNSVWFLASGGSTFSQITGITWNSNGYFEKTVDNMPGDGVFVTIDGNQPNADLSNVAIYYSCVRLSAGGSFTTIIACGFTDGTHTGPIYLTV